MLVKHERGCGNILEWAAKRARPVVRHRCSGPLTGIEVRPVTNRTRKHLRSASTECVRPASRPAVSDPYYRSEPARWLINTLWSRGVRVVLDHEMDHSVSAHRESRTIWLRPGESAEAMSFWVTRALLYIEGGACWAPEFRRRDAAPEPRLPLRVVLGGAS